MSELQELLSEDGYAKFLISVDVDANKSMSFEVLEVGSWECDGNNTPSCTSLYVSGYIRWDGCSHVWFGEEGRNGHRDGYIHLCGKDSWEKHCLVMRKIYELAEEKLERLKGDK